MKQVPLCIAAIQERLATDIEHFSITIGKPLYAPSRTSFTVRSKAYPIEGHGPTLEDAARKFLIRNQLEPANSASDDPPHVGE